MRAAAGRVQQVPADVVNQSLRSSLSRPSVSVENRKPGLTPSEAFPMVGGTICRHLFFPFANRPDRYEPRVKKKRGSNYNLMMQPREELRNRLKEGDNSFETK